MNAKPVVGVLLLVLAAVTGCGAGKPSPPKALCKINTPASAISPLLPEDGERVTEKRKQTPTAQNHCSVFVDDAYYFNVEHDLDKHSYSMSPDFVRKQPREFTGKLGVDRLQAVATTTCPKRDAHVYAAISLNVSKADLYADARDDLEKFLNAYIPAVQKHYGCKS